MYKRLRGIGVGASLPFYCFSSRRQISNNMCCVTEQEIKL